jgi:alpha-beta hydrolase superfamily lysophospholipase
MSPHKGRRRRRTVLIGVFIAYAASMTFGGCADRLILFPSKQPIDAGRAQRFTIQNDGRDLEVWTARSPAAEGREPEAYVLEFCGNATRAEDITQYVADRWSRFPVEVWVMNYPGYGGSQGRARLSLIAPAAMTTYDALANRSAGRPIFLAGNSLGSVPALYVAAHRPSAGLVLQNPPPLRKLILGQHGWWNLWLLAGPVALQVPGELDSLDHAPRVTSPAVFLLADQDGVVPPKYQTLVTDAYAGPKRLIPLSGAGHNDSVKGHAERQLQCALDWLWESSRR